MHHIESSERPSPAIAAPASSPAPADAGQGVGTSIEGFPPFAEGFNQSAGVVREADFFKHLGFVTQASDCQLPILTGNTLELFTDELADVSGGIARNQPGLVHDLDSLLIDVVGSYRRAFTHFDFSLVSRDEVDRISDCWIAEMREVLA